VIGGLESFRARFKAWDRNFGWTYRTAIFVAFLVALIGVPFWILSRGSARSAHHSEAALSQSGTSSTPPQLTTSSLPGIDRRPLYPYSIIPGGAYSQDELARAIENDPVVARHYGNFAVGKTRVVRLDHSELMYVSYRIGNQVFWTNKRLLIPAGEALLTDGENTARTRCGNRLSASAAMPLSPNQPSQEAMDAAPDLDPLSETLPFPELAISAPPNMAPAGMLPAAPFLPDAIGVGPMGGLHSPIPPLDFPIVGGGSGLIGAPGSPASPGLPPPIATPEPGTLGLLLIGFGAAALFYWRKLCHGRVGSHFR
jgi:PEP-CTERM motif